MDTESSAESELTEELLRDAGRKIEELLENLQSVIQGKREALELLVTALLANGSVLMEDARGLGKTTLAKSLAVSLDAH